MKAVLAALLVALFAPPALAQGDVSLDKDVTYYNVSGDTLDEIARSLRRDAPRDLDGFQGQANFRFSWTYNYDQIGERNRQPQCEVNNARVEIRIVVTLPRHRSIGRAPEDVEETWNTFAEALETHELNHAEDFERIGRQIPEALNGLTGPCRTIEDIANAKGMDYVDAAQQAADDYDAETNHGETEGTVFPGI
jgi:predicted secreted Zn-dependent protease